MASLELIKKAFIYTFLIIAAGMALGVIAGWCYFLFEAWGDFKLDGFILATIGSPIVALHFTFFAAILFIIDILVKNKALRALIFIGICFVIAVKTNKNPDRILFGIPIFALAALLPALFSNNIRTVIFGGIITGGSYTYFLKILHKHSPVGDGNWSIFFFTFFSLLLPINAAIEKYFLKKLSTALESRQHP